MNLNRLWKDGSASGTAPVYVSMNDYLVTSWRHVPLVASAGMRLRRSWPTTPGAVGLWFAAFDLGRRQVSVSVWRSAEDLRRFVNLDVHRRLMREYREAGVLYTTAWTSDSADRCAIWRQAEDRLLGRVAGVQHH